MSRDNVDLETSDWRSVRADLTDLVAEGIGVEALESCRGLERSIRRELGLPDALPPDVRVSLLTAVLSAVVAERRQEAFEHREEGTFRSAVGRPANQIAAAGELLGLTDDEQWRQIRDLRCRQFEETWDALRAKAESSGPLTERRLRAMLWIGFSSVKTIERAQPGLVQALESAIKEYAEKNRVALAAVVERERWRTPRSPVAAPAAHPPLVEHPTSAANSTSVATRPRRFRDKRYGPAWMITAAVAVGTVIMVSLLLERNVDPSPGLEPESSIASPEKASPAPTLTPKPTRSDAGRPHGITRLLQLSRCHHLPASSPLARRLRASGRAIVDGRCRAHPIPRIDARSGPSRRSRTLAHLQTGQVIRVKCLRYRGQKTSNAIGVSSRRWVRYRLMNRKRDAFVSALWIQGEDATPHCSTRPRMR